MKTIIGALALIIAVPAAAQTQPAQHGDHGQHHGMNHGEQHKDCCKNADGTAKACCEKARKEGKKMPCCDKQGQKGQGEHAGHKAH